MTAGYDAIVLAGGRGARMSGLAKPQLVVGATSMLERVLSAVSAAGIRVVVGPQQPVADGVRIVQEHPVGSGPVAGLATGLDLIMAPVVVVLAADLPFLTREAVETLVAVLNEDADVDGAILRDDEGREQYLLGAWRTEALGTALAGLGSLPGRAMRDLARAVRITRVDLPVPDGGPAPWTDVDTPADLDLARDRARHAS